MRNQSCQLFSKRRLAKRTLRRTELARAGTPARTVPVLSNADSPEVNTRDSPTRSRNVAIAIRDNQHGQTTARADRAQPIQAHRNKHQVLARGCQFVTEFPHLLVKRFDRRMT